MEQCATHCKTPASLPTRLVGRRLDRTGRRRRSSASQNPKSIWAPGSAGRRRGFLGASAGAATGRLGAGSDPELGRGMERGIPGNLGARAPLRGGGGGTSPDRLRFPWVSSLSPQPTRPGDTRTRRGNATSRSMRQAVDRLMLAIRST